MSTVPQLSMSTGGPMLFDRTDRSSAPGRRRTASRQQPAARQRQADASGSDRWKGSSPLMDLSDRKLKLLARSLVDGLAGERERALAVYQYIRRMPLAATRKWGARTARAVMERKRGDAVDKATLFVALLRIAGLPARVVFAPVAADVLRGLATDMASTPRPFVEVRVAGDWIRTDTYIFDAAYMDAAHHRLRTQREESGYGVSTAGAQGWNGQRNAYVLGVEQEDTFSDTDERAFHDVREFARSLRMVERLKLLVNMFRWNAQAQQLDRSLRALRARQPRPPAPRGKRKPAAR